MHFSQGWVQFGYRFSLDFAPFLLVAMALGTERFLGPRGASRPWRLGVVVGLVGGVGGDPGMGHRLGPDARLVSAAADRLPAAGRPEPGRAVLRRRRGAAPRRDRRRSRLARSVLLPGQGFWDTGEFQTVAPLLGTAHPTGYPTYVILGWLASLVAGAGRRAGAADEPPVRAPPRGGGRPDRRPRPPARAGGPASAVAAGLLLALTPIAWRIGRVRRPAHAAPRPPRRRSSSSWSAGSGGGGRTPAGADRWLVRGGRPYGVMLGNHSLTALLAPGIALFLLAVEPGIVRRPRLVAACAARAARDGRRPLPRAARSGPRWAPRSSTARPDTSRRVPVRRPRPSSSAATCATRSATSAGKVVDLVGGSRRPSSGSSPRSCPAAFVVVALRRPRFALLTGTWLVVTCWFARRTRTPGIDRYYLGPLLIAVVWLGVAAGLVVDAARSVRPAPDAPRRRGAPSRGRAGSTGARRPGSRGPLGPGAGRRLAGRPRSVLGGLLAAPATRAPRRPVGATPGPATGVAGSWTRWRTTP